jgi:hypothetical protein
VPTTTEPDDVYAARAARFAAEEAAVARRFDRVANARLAAFLAAVACAGAGAALRQPILAAPAAALFVAFVVLVTHHGRLRRRRRLARVRREVNEEGRARIGRRWDELPLRHEAPADADHPYAADLDVFGRASLMHLLDTTATPVGQARLRSWLLARAAPDAIADRQGGVAELAPLLELREELQVRCRLIGEARPDPEPFLAWAEAEPWLTPRRRLLWAARVSPVLLWAGVAAWGLHLAPPLWPALLVANLAIWARLATAVEDSLARVRRQEGAYRQYAEALELLAGADLGSAALRRLRETCTLEGAPAHRHVRRVGRLAELAVPPEAQLHIVVQALSLWNVHMLVALERWQARAGRSARAWLDAVGTFEALTALAALAHDNPGWARPEQASPGAALQAKGLGHPLIPPAARVDNDVTVGPPGTFLFVTGSNMAGKSTLLRAIGTNVVLAQAGAAVCARSLRLPPLELWTSIRVVDSLERGVSFFLAELRRLHRVVEAARGRGPELCYLLDEVLQGTNTAERQVAARRVIRHLVASGAIGAVTTHDLTLAESPEMLAIARPVHLRETLVGDGDRPVMTFDYRLREGVATSTNALRLMAMVGLAEQEP